MTLDRYSDRYAFETGKEPWTDADFEERMAIDAAEAAPPAEKPTGTNGWYDIEAGESQDYPDQIRRWERESLSE